MARDLIFEIGTEEIPARFMNPALEQMAAVASQLLQEYRLPCQKVATYGTPRRLALYLTALAENQEELVQEIKGPPVKAAYTADGQPTKAALGFARSMGVAVEELVTREYNGGQYVFAIKREQGRPAVTVLPELLLAVVNALSFPKPMRWGSLEIRFARPIRWLLALFGSEVIPVELAGLTASNQTYGHRFLAPGPHQVPTASAYFQVLEENYVLVDQHRRRQLIWEQITGLASREGGRVEKDPELLEEITYLLEYPTALAGHFDPEYLKLPQEVVITPMRDHQRYFPVWNAQGELLPRFITVHNGTADHLENISRGNERVLAARLADAAFFYQEDRQTPLAAKVPKLEEIVFQESLGTMMAKTRRLQRLAVNLVNTLDLPAELVPLVERTAELAKADLVTAMVYEFPELQGIMGSYYAAHDGEKAEVCQGIRQHYWPRFAGDRLPDSLTGMVVGLADRLDTLVGCFGAGLIPTGSQDPYALRRQATGVVTIAVEFNLKFSLTASIAAAYEGYTAGGIQLARPLDVVQEQLVQFCRQRLEHLLEEKGYRYDVIQACLAASSDDLAAAYHRTRDLSAFREEEGFAALQTAFTRAFNLARQAREKYHLRPEALQEKAEAELYRALMETRHQAEPRLRAGDYLAALKAMAALRGPIDAFFDNVLVMAPDMEVRNNRLALLQAIVNLVFQIADFSRLVP
ncbi:glycine--tRNA ligase subunit beta [Neomoorella thermoacetica]|uniref:glycine--tRNA ligase subunit beta n=1 Tax=Neomoorella thermoacetica TaxID=1525 RepID=UPI0008FB4A48|nr:glycine--tRNA ligase subunit beta [Moorella thermoacetica]APC07725.1 glycine--tRNA ligase beta subunit [Moorella thermoacetica]OIQ53570.1 glycine--tRNA ligase beta subunit [Moorella thermoacetica]